LKQQNEEESLILKAKDPRTKAKLINKTLLKHDAEQLVRILEECNGDIDRFLSTFHTTFDSETTIQFQIEMLLNQDENKEWRRRWDAAIAAYKRIRIARAQRAALEVITHIKPVQRTSKNFNQVQAHAKLLLNADLTAQTHRAKKQVDKQMIHEDEEPDELDALLEKMA
jgi:hypothetical protein